MRLITFDIGIKNLAYCDISLNGPSKKSLETFDNLHVNKLDIIELVGKDQKVKDIALDQIARALFKNLEIFKEVTYDVVLIENQPVKLNPIMKTIQVMVYSQFQIWKKEHDLCTDIRFMSAINKTKVLNLFDKDIIDQITSSMTLSSKYANTKRMSILISEHILDNHLKKNDPNTVESFKHSKKKDDLSDSFLMAVYFSLAF